ncbi:Alkylhydroperoxidase family enzyme, contains CxxC motif [Geodermatophilus telluris]|uniref:Alkylhydroperoxidase family enzyme, contains CxxC motif n=1 Tax=Geodermatophilus telluris TaxID=1190417 RepID=A0A1G6IQ92_9ACTN|nr:carboxymuconolactone decarboxylase family protein [Geodermatophilus telluris]SDC08658.1 Alkylhydroperoxidase family enzyme, contains CxxC motif [Geodermatophilus telluris]
MTATTARIPLDPPRTLLTRAVDRYSRRVYGATLAPAAAMGHHPRLLVTQLRHERALARWDRLDPTLKSLAVMSAAVTVGCSWCVDFGWWVTSQEGTDPAKLRAVPAWRDSDVLTDLERRVVEYAEAMSTTPMGVTDEMVAALRRDLDDAALVELTTMVAVENARARTNSALGLPSQGFRDRCELPARA